ncbi:MAG TPA: carboxypeptidase-like regulatory domain-containing protein [Tepidisphaeraceae bacterium]|nr:carboxypeptidase-like regulatory domain-containing protein [Tepidisphaeraceae bacterium]
MQWLQTGGNVGGVMTMRRILCTNLLILALAALCRADQLRGKVVGPDGRAGADATVSVAFGEGPNLRPPETIQADGQGEFMVDLNENSGPVGLRAMSGTTATPQATVVQLPVSEPVVLKMAANVLGIAGGRVVDSDGKPLADASVELIVRLEPCPFGMGNDAGLTDRNGRFEVRSLWPDGNYSIAVTKDGYGVARRDLQAERGASASLSDIVMYRRDSSIAGVLLDAAGKAEPNRQFLIFGQRTGIDRIATDGAGRFSDEVMSGDRFTIFIPSTSPRRGRQDLQTAVSGDQHLVLHDNSTAPALSPAAPEKVIIVGDTGVENVWKTIDVIVVLSGTLIVALFIAAVVQSRRRKIRA